MNKYLIALITALSLSGCLERGRVAREAVAPVIPHAENAGVEFDLQGFITDKIAAGEKRVVIPAGRYRVKPERGIHLLLEDIADVEIVARGVEMVCTQTSQAIMFKNCRNLKLSGLAIDYDPLPFTQGRIVALGPEKSWLEFELFDGYPDHKLEERIEIFDPVSGELRRSTLYGWQPFEKVGDRRYRVAKPEKHRFNAAVDLEEIGDILVTNNSFNPDGNRAHAVYSSDCVNLVLEDIWLFASNCFGFLETGCENTTYLRCRIGRRPLELDYPERGYKRMRSLNADAFHSKHAVIGPQIISCTAKFQGDDCVNICGDYNMILAVDGPVMRVAAKHRMNIEEGDPVEFLPYAGPRPADAKALTIEPCAGVTADERAFIAKQRMNDGIQSHLMSARAKVYDITLDRAVDLPMGSLICSGNRTGNGFLVRDCDFGYNRSRGILIKASRGGVVGNRITRSWMTAVLVSPEFWWCESAASSDLEIRDNLIEGCRDTAISIQARGGDGRTLPSGAHRNISVCGNRISDSPLPNIHVTSTDKLLIEGNQFNPLDPALSRFRRGENTTAAIVTEACSQVEVQEE